MNSMLKQHSSFTVLYAFMRFFCHLATVLLDKAINLLITYINKHFSVFICALTMFLSSIKFWFVSSLGNMDVMFSHLHFIVDV